MPSVWETLGVRFYLIFALDKFSGHWWDLSEEPSEHWSNSMLGFSKESNILQSLYIILS